VVGEHDDGVESKNKRGPWWPTTACDLRATRTRVGEHDDGVESKNKRGGGR
jgi:hypothetical protein